MHVWDARGLWIESRHRCGNFFYKLKGHFSETTNWPQLEAGAAFGKIFVAVLSICKMGLNGICHISRAKTWAQTVNFWTVTYQSSLNANCVMRGLCFGSKYISATVDKLRISLLLFLMLLVKASFGTQKKSLDKLSYYTPYWPKFWDDPLPQQILSC